MLMSAGGPKEIRCDQAVCLLGVQQGKLRLQHGGDQGWAEGLTQTADTADQYVHAVSCRLVAVARYHLDAKGKAVLLRRLALECHRPQGCLQVQGQQ